VDTSELSPEAAAEVIARAVEAGFPARPFANVAPVANGAPADRA
jgi:hypothetical protein